jgi:hypothetical protein
MIHARSSRPSTRRVRAHDIGVGVDVPCLVVSIGRRRRQLSEHGTGLLGGVSKVVAARRDDDGRRQALPRTASHVLTLVGLARFKLATP